MGYINKLRIRRISLVLLAGGGLTAGFFALAAFTGAGFACWLFLAAQAWMLFRMLRQFAVEESPAIFLSILLTIISWVAGFLLIAAGGRMVY